MSERQFSHSGLKRKEFNMNRNIVQESWKQLKSKVTAHWDKLNSINTITGKEEATAGEIQEIHGVAQGEAEEQIERIKDTNKD